MIQGDADWAAYNIMVATIHGDRLVIMVLTGVAWTIDDRALPPDVGLRFIQDPVVLHGGKPPVYLETGVAKPLVTVLAVCRGFTRLPIVLALTCRIPYTVDSLFNPFTAGVAVMRPRK